MSTRKERRLAKKLRREKAESRAKDEFLAALSHELRIPLNPVLLLASHGAGNRDLPAEIRKNFDTICDNIEVQARLIDDLLDLTRISRRKLALVNTSGVGQCYRSCWCRDMNDPLRTYLVNFLVAQIHSTHQSSGQGSRRSIWIVRALDIDEMRGLQCCVGQIYSDL